MRPCTTRQPALQHTQSALSPVLPIEMTNAIKSLHRAGRGEQQRETSPQQFPPNNFRSRGLILARLAGGCLLGLQLLHFLGRKGGRVMSSPAHDPHRDDSGGALLPHRPHFYPVPINTQSAGWASCSPSQLPEEHAAASCWNTQRILSAKEK